MSQVQQLPLNLRTWFVIHFVADMLFAIPLMLAPEYTLQLLGWTTIDPIATRLVAAALFGIGIESLLGRKASPETFKAMLNLKVIWSGTASLGIVWSVLNGGPESAWMVAGIFAVFCVVWTRYRILMR
ncbi:MAG: hypothetical protein Q8O95_04170 [bacterium]|nr:hypothetical protein [bacterium]